MPVFVNPRGHLSPFGEKPTIAVNTGWPEKHLLARPNDALGQAILDYRDKWQHHKDFPVEGPWDSRRGEIFLRDLDEPEAEFDEVPRYRVKPAAAFIGCVLFTQGQISSFQGYPANPSELEPENESARRVLSFMMRYLGS